MVNNILSIKNFSVNFKTKDSNVIANQNINLDLKIGEILGIVGESGSGKTVLCKSILKLLPSPPANYKSGKIYFENHNILEQNEIKLREIRQKKIAMIFQNPMSSFNPIRKVGEQIIENLNNQNISKKTKKDFCIELLINLKSILINGLAECCKERQLLWQLGTIQKYYWLMNQQLL